MRALVIVLRLVPLLLFAGAMGRAVRRHRGVPSSRARSSYRDRAPLVANLAAFGAYVLALLVFSGNAADLDALLLAASGSLLSVVGVAFVVKARAELGPAWSFVPKADQRTGLVTGGSYRLVRHPIYFGLLLIAFGEAVAFGSWPALAIALAGVAPTFVWRARTEEKLLARIFGDRYAAYRRETKLLIPYLF